MDSEDMELNNTSIDINNSKGTLIEKTKFNNKLKKRVDEVSKLIFNEESVKALDSSKEDIVIESKKLELKREQLFIDEYNDYIRQRKNWSSILAGAIISLIIFNNFLIIGVGWGSLDISDNILISVYWSFVAEILGLAAIVVRYLFKEKPKLLDPKLRE